MLAEIPVLARFFPDVPPDVWLRAALCGAALLGIPGYGAFTPGTRPGVLVLFDVDGPADLTVAPPRRAWLARPGAPG